ncbi:glycosyl transferase [Bacillaceae bacterium]
MLRSPVDFSSPVDTKQTDGPFADSHPSMPVSFRHLERMTDDTGLLEHSFGKIPRRNEGYTTDDNARALWACAEWLEYFAQRERDGAAVRQKLLALADIYLAFLLWAQKDNGLFHNNFAYDRRPEEETPSDDCLGRALWACAVAYVKFRDEDRRGLARAMFWRAFENVKELQFPRGWAYSLAACCLLSEHETERRQELQTQIAALETRLVELYRSQAKDGWRWFEPEMTYGNGVLPWALFHAFRATGRDATLETARDSLDFLLEKMTSPHGTIRPVGNRGWCTRDRRSDWDQQPLDVMKLALAAAQAYRVLGDAAYREVVEKCRAWFYGENDLRVPLADAREGSCCDGLTPEGANRNQGAESTLSYLLTEAIYHQLRS